MARPYKPLEAWLHDAAELMVRTGCGLVDAATELGKEITSQDAINISKRRSFNKLLWQERHKFYLDLGADPSFNQDVVVGRMLAYAQRLEEEGEFEKASDVLLKLAKIKGWVGPESQVSVFGELSQRDLDAIKESVIKETVQ